MAAYRSLSFPTTPHQPSSTQIISNITMPLLNLPLEVRTQIFGYLFRTECGRILARYHKIPGPLIWSTIYSTDGKEDYDSPSRILSILRTCKQINNECKDLIWKCNCIILSTHGSKHFDLPNNLKSKVQSAYTDVELSHKGCSWMAQKGCISPNDNFLHPREWHSLRKLDLQVMFYSHYPGYDFGMEQVQRLLKYRRHSSGSDMLHWTIDKGKP